MPTLTLQSPNTAPWGAFGTSVALSSNFLAVGAPGETVNRQTNAGRVYIFNARTGSLLATLTSPNPQANGNFGSAISVTVGDHVVVGAYGETVNGQGWAGNAYLYKIGGALVSQLSSPFAQPNGMFGSSVGIGPRGLVVGAPGENARGLIVAGRAYIFDSVTGALRTALISPHVQFDAFFGWSVVVSDEVAVVGAVSETLAGPQDAGSAYVYNILTGAPISTLVSPNSQAGGSFGWWVSAAARGGVGQVGVGAVNETAGGQPRAGRAYVFQTLAGPPITQLASPNPQFNGEFGASLTVAGSEVVVGAQTETVNALTLAGRAYIFTTNTGTLVRTLVSPNVQAGGGFGSRVAMEVMNGLIVAVGALWEFGAEGRVYVFS
jgi:FG-GAP repeat